MRTTKTENIQSGSHNSFSYSSKRKRRESFFSSSEKVKGSFYSQATIQSKLEIGQADDKYEQEADRMADAVMRMPNPRLQMQPQEEEEKLQMKSELGSPSQMKPEVPQIQRMCPRCRELTLQGKPLDCPECEKKLQMSPAIQRQGDGQTNASPEMTNQLNTTKRQRTPLPPGIQQEMSYKMGADFSRVRIHTGSKAVQMNRQLGAKAFTHGRNIYFNTGQYNPDSEAGKKLLAHELSHVIQQARIPQQIQRNNFQHPSSLTAKEVIANHTSGGNLDEAALGRYLLDLVWMSPSHIDFAEQVRKALGGTDRDYVVYAFCVQANDPMIQSLASTEGGRMYLRQLRMDMAGGWATSKEREQISRLRRIVERIREEVSATEWRMMQVPETPFTINVYPSGRPIDAAEVTMPDIARRRPGEAVGVRSLAELLVWIKNESEERKKLGMPHQLEAMSLLGHGHPGHFAIGDYMYSAETLRDVYRDVSVEQFVREGSTIIFSGCDAGGEPGGLELMQEFGRIFFGDKSGILRANTCPVVAMGETTTCEPVEFHYPEMLRLTPEEIVRQAH
jgi:hypothetical protein